MYTFIQKLNRAEARFLAQVISQVEISDAKFKCYIINKRDFTSKLDFGEFLSKTLEVKEKDSVFFTSYFTTLEVQNDFYRVFISEKLKPYFANLNKNYDVDSLEALFAQEDKNAIVKKTKTVDANSDEFNLKIKRVVAFFDQERKKLQRNFIRKEYRNMDAEYMLRLHLKETNRTPEMFYDAIRWLFSNNPKAAFHRDYIMNIAKLIEHYNTLEHQAMHSKEALEFNEEAQTWANIYKKQGMDDAEIIEKLREAGFIK
ncbi:hypothetical protein M947_11635 [Sulfurimonas hongkongensis]|uniref:Uncharacterized protein n=1 Tax=Sulfurimonas hongkongensis TaxID=1172190 RepID=T0JBS8_9BACT|nr:hypothetical protein [Sulfurimonas hongkongensis]EQB34282.1 hypothetical protein M947_11635 [Sulfurimonas hongkongensis]